MLTNGVDLRMSMATSTRITAVLLYGGAVLIGVNLVAVPASSVFLKNLHSLSNEQYGAVFLPQLIAAIVGALAAGRAVLHMSLKAMYALALVAFVLSLGSLALSGFVEPNWAIPAIMLSTALFGFGFGFGGGPLNGLVYIQFPNQVGSAIAALHMMAGVGLVFGPVYFNGLESLGSWLAGPLIAMFLAMFLLIAVIAGLAQDEPQVSSEEGKQLPIGELYFWLMVAIAFLYGLVEATFSNWAIIFVNEARGLSLGTAATALSAFWGGLTVGRLLATVIVRSIQPVRIWIALPMAIAVALYLLPLAEGAGQVIAAFAVGGLACSAFFPLMVTVASEPFPHAVSWIVSMLTAALMGGVGIVSYLVGRVVQSIPMDDVYAYSVAYPLVMLGLMLLALRIKGSIRTLPDQDDDTD